MPISSSATSSPARSSTRSSASAYFLPPLDLTDRELAALQTACTCSRASSRTPSRCAWRCRTSRWAARTRRGRERTCSRPLTRRQRLLRPRSPRAWPSSRRRSRSRDDHLPVLRDGSSARTRRARVDPYSVYMQAGRSGTSSAATTTATRCATFRLSRMRGDVRFATPPRARLQGAAADFDAAVYRDRADVAARRDRSARPSLWIAPSAAWMVERLWPAATARSSTATTARSLLDALRRRAAAGALDARAERPGAAARPG